MGIWDHLIITHLDKQFWIISISNNFLILNSNWVGWFVTRYLDFRACCQNGFLF